MTDTNRITTVFSQADDNIAPTIPGWPSATLTGKKGDNDATGLTYSNIEAPKEKLFAVEYGDDGAEVEFSTEGTVANAHWARSNIPAANKYTGGSTGGSIPGSYRGVEGAFTCKVEGCPASGAFPERRTGGTIVGTEDDRRRCSRQHVVFRAHGRRGNG